MFAPVIGNLSDRFGRRPVFLATGGVNLVAVPLLALALGGVGPADTGALLGYGLLITVLACFLGRVDPFGGFGRALPVALALLILQVISSGLNLLGANQHLATAMWGAFLIVVMVVRHVLAGRSVRRT